MRNTCISLVIIMLSAAWSYASPRRVVTDGIIHTNSDSLGITYGPDVVSTLPMVVVYQAYAANGIFSLDVKFDLYYGGKPCSGSIFSETDSLVGDYSEEPIPFTIIAGQDTIPCQVVYISADYHSDLCAASEYSAEYPDSDLEFIYQDPSDSNLVKLRETYNLDMVAGQGDEISRIVNLMKWVNQMVRWDGKAPSPSPPNALHLLKVCKDTNRAVNCRMMATILNEVYLSMGFKSRHISCKPKDENDSDSHVTNIVYSEMLNKWLYMDPSFAVYYTDKDGTLLNHAEIREATIRGDSLVVCIDANDNGRPYSGGTTGYTRYMTKNLYRFYCPVSSEFGYESKKDDKTYVYLNPLSYNPEVLPRHTTQCADFFWQKPE